MVPGEPAAKSILRPGIGLPELSLTCPVMSARITVCVCVVAVLLARNTSVSLIAADALLVIVDSTEGVATTIVTIAVASTFRVPMLQMIEVVAEQVPTVEFAETNVCLLYTSDAADERSS